MIAKRSRIVLEVVGHVEPEPGTVLPRGLYQGSTRSDPASPLTGGSWTVPDYLIELSAEQWARLCNGDAETYGAIEFDVTRFVRSGDVVISAVPAGIGLRRAST